MADNNINAAFQSVERYPNCHCRNSQPLPLVNSDSDVFASVYCSSSMSQPENSSILFDRGSAVLRGFNISSNGAYLTPSAGGYYFVTFGVDCSGFADSPEIHLRRGGAECIPGTCLRDITANGMVSISKIIHLDPCESVDVFVTGGFLNLLSAHVNAYLDMLLLHKDRC